MPEEMLDVFHQEQKLQGIFSIRGPMAHQRRLQFIYCSCHMALNMV